MTTPSSTDEARCHIIVRGRVQGVGYRHFALQTARRLGLKGWVRNRINGTVEIVAQGKRAAIEAFLEALRRGPSMAYVTAVEATWEPPRPDEESLFRVRGTR